jgi:hypothetical protein
MANLIITVIAIALVAIASLMGAYYGGSTYLNSQMLADAATVLSEATQVAAAWNAYRGDNLNNAPATLAALLNTNQVAAGSYLQSIPTAPRAAGNVSYYPVFIASTGTHYFVYADVGTPTIAGGSINDPYALACMRIQKTATGTQPTLIGSAAQGSIAALGNGIYGCGVLTGSVTGGLTDDPTPPGADLATGDYVFEYLIQ